MGGNVCVCVCLYASVWVHSPAVSFRADHINDKRHGAIGCSLKRKWEKKVKGRRAEVWRSVGLKEKKIGLELESKISRQKKSVITKNTHTHENWNNNVTQHLLGNISPSRPPPPLAHASSFYIPPPLCSTTRLPAPPGPELSHIISVALRLRCSRRWRRCRCCCCCPARAHPLLPRSSAESPLPHGRKVIPPSPEWWWTEQRRRERAGGGSICLVNFNVQADVSLSLCVLVRSVGWERVWCYDHIRECLLCLLWGHFHSC